MASRIIVALQMAPAAKKAVEGLTDKHGMTQVAMMSRLVEWLADQPATIQSAVLGRVPSDAGSDVAKLIMQRAAGKKV
jgi:hypothetical protein